MKIDVLDIKGKSIEKIDLDVSVFGIEPNLKLLTQYLRVLSINKRQGTSSTKTRGEVSGGGKKPWRQKGTGRARHGSIRSPIWVGGGIAHGPKPKLWSLNISKKMRQKAITSALSLKVSRKQLLILDALKFKEPKTKEMSEVLKNLKVKGNVLLVLNNSEDNVLKSARNIKGLNIASVNNLNGFEILKNRNLIFVKDAVIEIEKKYATK